MNVKVLGTGCKKCHTLEERVRKVAEESNLKIELEKVSDINKIMEYGIMMTPGLVISGEVKSSGKIPSKEQIQEWIQNG
jgi:small redox-active disulfide protein 2